MSTLSLDTYRLLGRSGLRVSPLSLGTMTFGAEWGWGADPAESRRMFDLYIDRGGNFIDTANFYTNGSAESLIGEFAQEQRERLVLATKYSLNTRPGDPNAGGNHRKNMVRSVEASLRRLRTDYIDLLYLHVWDGNTPVEEIMRAMDDLVRAGKVLYLGISDTPAWQVARMQTIAALRGWAPLIALQIEYSLIERTVEADLLPMARELGLGVLPWSPLGGGILSGKYTAADLTAAADAGEQGSRKATLLAMGSISPRKLQIAREVAAIAAELHATPASVALAWTLRHPSVTSPIIGARTVAQLEGNLTALDVSLSAAHLERLAEVSAAPAVFPHSFLSMPYIQQSISGGAKLAAREDL